MSGLESTEMFETIYIYMLGVVTFSVVNSKLPPIQVGVTDIEKCFDKVWLQTTFSI